MIRWQNAVHWAPDYAEHFLGQGDKFKETVVAFRREAGLETFTAGTVRLKAIKTTHQTNKHKRIGILNIDVRMQTSGLILTFGCGPACGCSWLFVFWLRRRNEYRQLLGRRKEHL